MCVHIPILLPPLACYITVLAAGYHTTISGLTVTRLCRCIATGRAAAAYRGSRWWFSISLSHTLPSPTLNCAYYAITSPVGQCSIWQPANVLASKGGSCNTASSHVRWTSPYCGRSSKKITVGVTPDSSLGNDSLMLACLCSRSRESMKATHGWKGTWGRAWPWA
jgi:hypothetical protein